MTVRHGIPLGALICGTDLATCYRRAAALFFHCPNTVQTLHVLPYVGSRASLRGHYYWNSIVLLTHRLESLVFSSVLLAYRSFRMSPRPHLDPPVNIFLHLLGNGLSCGEAIRPIARGETLIRHWDLGEYQWRHTERTRWWSYESGANQARILYDLLKPSDDYYLDCLRHDADHTRPDRTQWYCEDTFNSQALLVEACEADLVERRRQSKERLHAELEASERLLHQEASERLFMQSSDVNVLLIV